MMTIGDFSRLSGLSVKTLRYYDERGLFKPASIDEQSGYRYYAAEQLLSVKRIAALKDQGFTLEQIKALLAESARPEQVKISLSGKRSELLRTIREARKQLQGIESRLSRLEDDEAETGDAWAEPVVRSVPPRLAAVIRARLPRSQRCLLLDEVLQYAASHGESDGRSLSLLWRDDGRSETEPAELAVALPLTREIPGSDRVRIETLPGLEAAVSLTHFCDPYAHSCQAFPDLRAWIRARGWTPSEREPFRETYLTPDQEMYGMRRRAELVVPLE
ncbi:MerR family transcriptional regulator [Cohnella zeiphila]|uniref:MerR family transcriptional regulator n=1 Tax=Cohnella zeiphila TaxID=2761120 RepID=A0A7X0VX92_9BACL|nr:MerR family transcriptional regulator [Cohnella zeiphila]MBB6733207.1 MerR family transcriptional regulator [Cohnella zeiphila]